MNAMKPRLSKCEILERRQLLAGDVCLADQPAITAVTVAEPEIAMIHPPVVPGMDVGQSDWVEEDGGQLVVIQMNTSFHARPNLPLPIAPESEGPVATAYLFDRGDDGTLESVGAIELEFLPEKVIWSEHRLTIVESGLLSHKRYSAVATGGADEYRS